MLFDDNELCRNLDSHALVYFNEILQSYYNKSYRSAIVLLYSFLCYDLFHKLEKIVEQGDKEAENELLDLKNKISNSDTRYSEVESQIIDYFLVNFGTHFNKFKEDITYLKTCRHKCAHLNMNYDEVYHPKDYQVKMLILSMYENVFTKKAPFINDIFETAKNDIQKYNDYVHQYNRTEFEIIKQLELKYYNQMNKQACENSLRTFLKLLFVSSAEEPIKYSGGLYIFTDSLINYIIRKGDSSILYKDKIKNIIINIKLENVKAQNNKQKYLKMLMNRNFQFKDLIYKNNISLYQYIVEQIIRSSNDFVEFKNILNVKEKSLYTIFKDNVSEMSIESYSEIYHALESESDFEKDEILIKLFKKVPTYNGFDSADGVFLLFLDQIKYLKIETIEEILEIYCENNQFIKRRSHSTSINKFITTMIELGHNIDYSKYPKINAVYNKLLNKKENDDKITSAESEEVKVVAK